MLAALFLLSSTDLIIKEQKAEVYPISVIIEDTSDDYYVNFRKGMERAAVELNADVSFITLYEQGNRTQQMNFVLREQEDGNRALIVAPVDEEMVGELQASRTVSYTHLALGVRLAGDAWYFGKLCHKPTIGDDRRPVEAEDIKRANKLMYTAVELALLPAVIRLCAAVLPMTIRF